MSGHFEVGSGRVPFRDNRTESFSLEDHVPGEMENPMAVLQPVEDMRVQCLRLARPGIEDDAALVGHLDHEKIRITVNNLADGRFKSRQIFADDVLK